MSRSSLRNTGVVGSMTLLSRVLGLVRDMVFSRYFGAGMVMDAFFVAFKIPNFFRRMTAEGAFSQAFVPVFAEYRTQRTEGEVRELADAVWGLMGGVLFLITLIGVLAAPVLIMIFAPGFLDRPEQYSLATQMLRLTFPYLLFISLTALAAGILNTYGRFAVPAFTPVLLNVVLISFAIWASQELAEPGLGLALGVFVAGLVQLLFQLPFLARIRMFPRPRWRLGHEAVRRIGRLMLPALFGSSVAQINILLDVLIASFLVTGSISWLYYSDRMVEFPLGVFGVALATVLLPKLSAEYASGATVQFSRTLDWALRLACLIALPAAVGLLVLAGPIIATIFGYGKFTGFDVDMSAYSLMAYATGLPGFVLVKVLAPGYYSRQDTRTPVRVGVVALGANMVLNITLVLTILQLGLAAPHAGLALATGIAASLNAGLLYRGLRRREIYKPVRGWLVLAARVAAAVALMAITLWWLRGDIDVWLERSAIERVRWLTVCVLGGMAVYFVSLVVLGLRPRHLREHVAEERNRA